MDNITDTEIHLRYAQIIMVKESKHLFFNRCSMEFLYFLNNFIFVEVLLQDSQ